MQPMTGSSRQISTEVIGGFWIEHTLKEFVEQFGFFEVAGCSFFCKVHFIREWRGLFKFSEVFLDTTELSGFEDVFLK